MKSLACEILVPGAATGELALLGAALSFYGGFDVPTGTIRDATHPECGLCLTGRVLAMREARGSSSSASTLVEAARQGTAPAAIILARLDPILIIGAFVAQDLYGIAIPILLIDAVQWPRLRPGVNVRIDEASGLMLEDGG